MFTKLKKLSTTDNIDKIMTTLVEVINPLIKKEKELDEKAQMGLDALYYLFNILEKMLDTLDIELIHTSKKEECKKLNKTVKEEILSFPFKTKGNREKPILEISIAVREDDTFLIIEVEDIYWVFETFRKVYVFYLNDPAEEIITPNFFGNINNLPN